MLPPILCEGAYHGSSRSTWQAACRCRWRASVACKRAVFTACFDTLWSCGSRHASDGSSTGLREEECELSESGWGVLRLVRSTRHVGEDWGDNSTDRREDRKHKDRAITATSAGTVLDVPAESVLSVHGAGPYRIGARLQALQEAGLIDWIAPTQPCDVVFTGVTGDWSGVLILGFRGKS